MKRGVGMEDIKVKVNKWRNEMRRWNRKHHSRRGKMTE
jgi:hypothetical protein